MARGKKPLLENIEIKKIAAEGKSIAYVDEKVLFVPNTVPGDIVDVQVTRKRKSFLEGFIVNVRKYSDIRTEPFCSHFGVCGGCKWQNLPYQLQTEFKQQEIVDNLQRIGKVELQNVSPIIGSPKTTYYRNKLEYTFCNKRFLTREEIANGQDIDRTPAVGFHVPGLFDKVIDIKKCYLQAEPSNAVRNFIRDYAIEHELSFYDIREQAGFLRTLIIRTSSTGEVMVIVTFGEENRETREGLLNALVQQFPEITSLMYVINEKMNDTITDQEVICFHGNDHIFEQMEDLKFKIGPKSFYQTNSKQAYNLYAKTRELAGLTGNETVYDLYTGTGTIANFVARNAQKVIGIEYVPEAIEDAKINSALNNIHNTVFYAGDMKDVLNEEFIRRHGHPDVIITDPPRAGMHKDVVDTILKAAPDRIVYVSCNSATQARDLALMDTDYKVMAVQAVDMFPHTHHVENIVLLHRR
ncbi:MAG: 23S rRNA (uracil(1939)-C(5))-methyltransferase RlmD [Butyricimonas virosa]|uniref:23S rRNA (uracil(1939)-C(5))-methyltransferase RlmD n=1 Tax=Butyricimonas virosa TaxID=544645 RepID=UPI0024331423|nr:23S rRNA (uracil(1939)-C(5))-methyltransferase RlmD [Butyricimonas virosa]MCI7389885.1 23S rRNA (uracil(1939)-C(5))-methyltransferase RlmD [Butyricimonas virosa]MDY4905697.1 23S rRNA (uracil(1939)-C(5))-methyltransferase RlmD [Butyricimonas virosa]